MNSSCSQIASLHEIASKFLRDFLQIAFFKRISSTLFRKCCKMLFPNCYIPFLFLHESNSTFCNCFSIGYCAAWCVVTIWIQVRLVRAARTIHSHIEIVHLCCQTNMKHHHITTVTSTITSIIITTFHRHHTGSTIAPISPPSHP